MLGAVRGSKPLPEPLGYSELNYELLAAVNWAFLRHVPYIREKSAFKDLYDIK